MKRRDFLKYTSRLGAGSLFLNSLPLQSFATPNMLPLLNCQGIDERVLVIVFLTGGNDGLNTVIPLDQHGLYMGHRPTIGLPDTSLINLDNTLGVPDQIGIHPSMTSLKAMYDAGTAQVIQGVGYPNSNGSHFKSTDLWLTGGDGTSANFNLGSGWMGRFLNNTFPGLHGNPNSVFQDPLGIQLGDKKPSIGYIAENRDYVASNLTQQDPGGWYNLVQSIGTSPLLSVPDTDYGNQLNYIMSVENSTNAYAQRITEVFNAGTNSASVTYPDSDLSDQLQTVARLISGGSKTKIFLVHTGGFDTHSNQVVSGSPTTGTHANLLANVFDSIKAFHEDMNGLSLGDKVLSLAFSEFGRRITENGSFGTDHGNLAPMFLFGNAVEAGVKGTNINLDPALISSSGYLDNNTQMQFDYRQVYRTLLQDWLGGSDTAIGSTYFGTFNKIPSLVKSNYTADPTCYLDVYVVQSVVQAKIQLEGFFESENDLMHKKLVTKNLLPKEQPYNVAPFLYEGIESFAIAPPEIVDWVLVELRDANDISVVVAKRAALVRNDGVLVEMSGQEGITFVEVAPQPYFIAVYHRNHVPVVSSVAHDLSGMAVAYDFTAAATAAMGGNQLKEVSAGIFALHAGNFDGNGLNDNNDYAAWAAGSSVVGQYLPTDGDGNGVVNNMDYNLWKNNLTQTGHTIFQ